MVPGAIFSSGQVREGEHLATGRGSGDGVGGKEDISKDLRQVKTARRLPSVIRDREIGVSPKAGTKHGRLDQ